MKPLTECHVYQAYDRTWGNITHRSLDFQAIRELKEQAKLSKPEIYDDIRSYTLNLCEYIMLQGFKSTTGPNIKSLHASNRHNMFEVFLSQ